MGSASSIARTIGATVVAGPLAGRAQYRRERRGEIKKGRAKESEAKAKAVEQAAQAKTAAEVSAADEERAVKRRKRTIFAGADIEKNIFSRTLGGARGTTTLG